MRKVNLGLQLAGICILTVSTAQAVIYCPSTGTASSTDWLDQDLNITCQVFQSASLYSISLPASATYYAPYNGSGTSYSTGPLGSSYTEPESLTTMSLSQCTSTTQYTYTPVVSTSVVSYTNANGTTSSSTISVTSVVATPSGTITACPNGSADTLSVIFNEPQGTIEITPQQVYTTSGTTYDKNGNAVYYTCSYTVPSYTLISGSANSYSANISGSCTSTTVSGTSSGSNTSWSLQYEPVTHAFGYAYGFNSRTINITPNMHYYHINIQVRAGAGIGPYGGWYHQGKIANLSILVTKALEGHQIILDTAYKTGTPPYGGYAVAVCLDTCSSLANIIFEIDGATGQDAKGKLYPGGRLNPASGTASFYFNPAFDQPQDVVSGSVNCPYGFHSSYSFISMSNPGMSFASYNIIPDLKLIQSCSPNL